MSLICWWLSTEQYGVTSLKALLSTEQYGVTSLKALLSTEQYGVTSLKAFVIYWAIWCHIIEGFCYLLSNMVSHHWRLCYLLSSMVSHHWRLWSWYCCKNLNFNKLMRCFTNSIYFFNKWKCNVSPYHLHVCTDVRMYAQLCICRLPEPTVTICLTNSKWWWK